MRLRITWPGNETGEIGWRVTNLPADFKAIVDDVPDSAHVLLSADTGPGITLTEQADRVWFVEVNGPQSILVPRTVQLSATISVSGRATTHTTQLVSPIAQKMAAWLAVFSLLLVGMLAWITLKLPSNGFFSGVKLLLATGVGSAVIANLLAVRNSRTLPFGGFFHDLRKGAGAFLVTAICVFVLPRYLFTCVRNETGVPVAASPARDLAHTIPANDELFALSLLHTESARDKTYYDSIEARERYCVSPLQPECGVAERSSGILLDVLGIPTYTIRCNNSEWSALRELGASVSRRIRNSRDCGLDPSEEVPAVRLRNIVDRNPWRDSPPIPRPIDNAKVSFSWPAAERRGEKPREFPTLTALDMLFASQARLTVEGGSPSGAKATVHGTSQIASVEFDLGRGSRGWTMLPQPREVSWFQIEISTQGKERRLGILECQNAGDALPGIQFVLYALPFSRNRLASVTVLDGPTLISKWTADSDGNAWMCLPGALTKRPLVAEINLKSGWQSDSAWVIRFPSVALPREISIYSEDRELLGNLRCSGFKGSSSDGLVDVGPITTRGVPKVQAVDIGLAPSATSVWSSPAQLKSATSPWACREGQADSKLLSAKFRVPAGMGTFDPATLELNISGGKECRLSLTAPADAVTDKSVPCGVPTAAWLRDYRDILPVGCGTIKVCPPGP